MTSHLYVRNVENQAEEIKQADHEVEDVLWEELAREAVEAERLDLQRWQCATNWLGKQSSTNWLGWQRRQSSTNWLDDSFFCVPFEHKCNQTSRYFNCNLY